MKKALQIALVFLWIFSVSGVVVSRHYCGPFLKSVELGHNDLHCTDMDEDDMPSDCCKNTTEFQSVEGDFLKINNQQQELPQLFVLYSVEFAVLELLRENARHHFTVFDSSGPPVYSPPLFIVNRAIII